MIKVEKVEKCYYSKGHAAFPALCGASMEAKEGELTAIVGASGAGKSTLLHMIACIENYDRGSITVDNVELRTLDENAAAAYRNTTVGIVLQNYGLIPDFTVRENIALPLRFARGHMSKREVEARVCEVAAQVGIADLLNKHACELSGGERQRAAIARAIVSSPKYVLADEPTGALDSKNAAAIMKLFRSVARQGIGVIVVTHDRDVAAACDIVYEISDGKIAVAQ